MCLVNIQAVNAQLLEGNHIILAGGILELFQPGFQALLRALQRLNGKSLCAACFEFLQTFFDFLNLFLQKTYLPLLRHGQLLKLTVPDDDGVVVAGCDSAAELLAVLGFKVLFRRRQNIGGWIETQKLRCPLFGQVVRDNK